MTILSCKVEPWQLVAITGDYQFGGTAWIPHAFFDRPETKPFDCPKRIGLSVLRSCDLAPLTILPFDTPAVWAYGDLRADLERSGTPIEPLDTMIAAHALSQQDLLVTNNTREFAKAKVPACSWTTRSRCLEIYIKYGGNKIRRKPS